MQWWDKIAVEVAEVRWQKAELALRCWSMGNAYGKTPEQLAASTREFHKLRQEVMDAHQALCAAQRV